MSNRSYMFPQVVWSSIFSKPFCLFSTERLTPELTCPRGWPPLPVLSPLQTLSCLLHYFPSCLGRTIYQWLQNHLVSALQDSSQNSLDLDTKYSSKQWSVTDSASIYGLYWLLHSIPLLSVVPHTWSVSCSDKYFLFCLYIPLCTALCMTEPVAFKPSISITMITQVCENNKGPKQNDFFFLILWG